MTEPDPRLAAHEAGRHKNTGDLDCPACKTLKSLMVALGHGETPDDRIGDFRSRHSQGLTLMFRDSAETDEFAAWLKEDGFSAFKAWQAAR
jgi:hypothetical protein